MTKTELTALAKSHNAKIISNCRNWAFYYIAENQIKSFLQILADKKVAISSHYDKRNKEYSITIHLK